MDFDMDLLIYPSYNSYLDRFITTRDRRYVSNAELERLVVEIREKKYGNLYTPSQFIQKQKELLKKYYPEFVRTEIFSRRLVTSDPVLRELGLRERLNSLKILSTIIYLCSHNKSGLEISGFIDFEDSLRRANSRTKGAVDWKGVFRGRAILRPKKTDLSYMNMCTGAVSYNNTENYTIIYSVEGLIFEYRGDHQILRVGNVEQNDNSFSRSNFFSKIYGDVIIFDHVIQRKM